MADGPHFTPALFGFLRDLEHNNDRDWFAANKARYVAEVRDPMLDFIAGFAPHLESISTRYVADPRANGGSLFRIHRDVRFAKDKRPYKTNAGAHFRHEAARDAHAPGFYLHLEPGGVFAASGVWHPDGPALAKIRDAIAGDAGAWRRVTARRTCRRIAETPAAGLRYRPSADRRPQAQGLLRSGPLLRGRVLRARLHGRIRADLPDLLTADPIPHPGTRSSLVAGSTSHSSAL
jgi:uncharacterized protein (TIGR02453 family)